MVLNRALCLPAERCCRDQLIGRNNPCAGLSDTNLSGAYLAQYARPRTKLVLGGAIGLMRQ